MSISKLTDKFTLGANFLPKLKDLAKKINEIIDSVNTLSGQTRNYKIYRALLTQTGTNAPTAVVLENELSGPIVWTRVTDGQYAGTLAGAFPANKVFFGGSSNAADTGTAYRINRANDNVIQLVTYQTFDASDVDDLLISTSVEVLVYD